MSAEQPAAAAPDEPGATPAEEAEQQPARKRQKGEPRQKAQKTRGGFKHMCHDFTNTGHCKYGDSCTFAHSQAELKPSQRGPVIPAARLQLRQRLAEPPPASATTRTTNPKPLSHIERDFTEMFWVSPNDPVATPLFQNDQGRQDGADRMAVTESERKPCTDEDQFVHIHKNELCIVGVAKTHSMFAEGRTVSKVEYKQDCSEISGKKKKGAPRIEQCSVLAVVTCSDGTEWAVRGAVPSRLIEINERLIADPSLLQRMSWTEGFIGVVRCDFLLLPVDFVNVDQYMLIFRKFWIDF